MALAQKLTQRQSQSLVMTPQLSQSIKLLALSNIELAKFIDEELERNPFLERNRAETSEPGQAAPTQQEDTSPTSLDVLTDGGLETSAQSLSENLGTSVENDFPDEQDYQSEDTSQLASAKGEDDFRHDRGLSLASVASSDDVDVADFTEQTKSLVQVLEEQLALAGTDPLTASVARFILSGLDDAGYWRGDLSAASEQLGCSLKTTHAALALVQTFDPVGVGARDLGECLSLQLRDRDRLDPAMEALLNNLDLLAKRDFASLTALTGLDLADLQDCLHEIRELDPKPGSRYSSTLIQCVEPDVFVTEAADGSWAIELNSNTLPRVLVNESYVTNVSGKLNDKSEREFITGCLQTANWLTKSLDQRARTILTVTKEIVRRQDAFLIHGVEHLKPMTLLDVAEEIEMHESTVSRVTSNKYVMTPRGLFELKYFFTTAIAGNTDGETHSAEAVKAMIRKLIEAETATTVLSDDALVGALQQSGVDIARRTVAKYRESMLIPSSVLRKREKRAQDALARTAG